MAKKKTAPVAAAPSPQEQFATLVAHYRTLPATDENGFKGNSPNEVASDFQKDILTKMGMGNIEGVSRLDAHASIKAFGAMYPEKAGEIWDKQKAEADAAKAAKAATAPAPATAATGTKFTKYLVKKDDVSKDATYHMLVQLNAAGIRKYGDTSPIPTRGEVADKLNALQASDKAKYDTAMSAAKKTVDDWKKQPPTDGQRAFAEAAGIKIIPWEANAEGKRIKGSTSFSVGEDIHELKTAQPEKYAEAAAITEAARKEAAATTATPAPAAPRLSAEEKVQAAVNAQAASTAAKTGTIPSLNIPAQPATQAQAEGPEAG